LIKKSEELIFTQKVAPPKHNQIILFLLCSIRSKLHFRFKFEFL